MVNIKNNYILLLVDVKNSTGLPGKAMNDKMKLLEQTLKKLNKAFGNQIALPLSISYGDEIAGLFHSQKDIYTIVIEIRKLFYPLTNIRFAVVKGKISNESADIRKVGGMVFKKASSAIAVLKETNRYAYWDLGNAVHDTCLGSLCEMSNALINDMSDYQREVFDLLSAGMTQKKIAQQLGKYTQSVWDAVQRSKAVYITEAQKAINLVLADRK